MKKGVFFDVIGALNKHLTEKELCSEWLKLILGNSLLRKVVNIKTVSKLNLINVFSQVNITFPKTFALIQGHCKHQSRISYKYTSEGFLDG